jgi:hypothetical protein
MRRPINMACLTAVLFLLALATVVAFAQGRTATLEGSRPYTPTRLEWLAVDLNARMRHDMSAEKEFTMAFVRIEKEDAILIYVDYLPSVNRQRMNQTVDTARQVIAIESKGRGWPWLKVKERVQMVEPK